MSSWSARRLLGVAEVVLGRQRSPEHESGPHMVPYLRAANVQPGQLDLNDVKSMNFSLREQRAFSLEPGDILVTEGSGSLASVGAAAQWQGARAGAGPVCFQNTLLRLRARAGVDARWLYWWAQHAFGSGLFAAVAGGANIYHLSAERVRGLEVSVPPLDEQRRIADFLDVETGRIDEVVRLRASQVSYARERAQAVLEFELTRLESIHGRVSLRRELLGVQQGASPQCEGRAAEAGERGVLKLSAVNRGQYLEGENKALPRGAVADQRFEVRPGDILMSRANTPDRVGDVAYVRATRPGLLLPDLVYRLVLRRPSEAEFVATALRSSRVRALVSATARGTSQSMVKLRGEDVADLPVPAAAHADRLRVASTVRRAESSAHELQVAIERSLTLLTERRQALITAAVTGQLDVTTARGVRA